MREPTADPHDLHDGDCCDHGRRRLFGLAAGAVAIAGGGALAAESARADALTKAQRDTLTPDQVLKMVTDGNARFVAGERKPRNFLAEQRSSAANG